MQNAPEEVPNVTKVVNKPHGRPLFTVRLCQTYIRALRKAGTPIGAPVVLASAKHQILWFPNRIMIPLRQL